MGWGSTWRRARSSVSGAARSVRNQVRADVRQVRDVARGDFSEVDDNARDTFSRVRDQARNDFGTVRDQATEDAQRAVDTIPDPIVDEFERVRSGWDRFRGNVTDAWHGAGDFVQEYVIGNPPRPGQVRPAPLRGSDNTPDDTSRDSNEDQLRAFAEASKHIVHNPLADDATMNAEADLMRRAPLGTNMLIGN